MASQSVVEGEEKDRINGDAKFFVRCASNAVGLKRVELVLLVEY